MIFTIVKNLKVTRQVIYSWLLLLFYSLLLR